MTRNTGVTAFGLWASLTMTSLFLSPSGWAENIGGAPAAEPTTFVAPRELPAAPLRLAPLRIPTREERAMIRWKLSLIPLAASQSLDISSSWGMRELNPVLAGKDGSFGMQASAIKLGVMGAVVGVEYLIVHKHPNAARAFEKLNWCGAAVTSSFAVHNYAIR
jgi:hypothetical protein